MGIINYFYSSKYINSLIFPIKQETNVGIWQIMKYEETWGEYLIAALKVPFFQSGKWPPFLLSKRKGETIYNLSTTKIIPEYMLHIV